MHVIVLCLPDGTVREGWEGGERGSRGHPQLRLRPCRVLSPAGELSLFVTADPARKSGASLCRRLGSHFRGVGGTRTNTLLGLRGLAALSLATGRLCISPECTVYTAVECVPMGKDACQPDEAGNIGEAPAGHDRRSQLHVDVAAG